MPKKKREKLSLVFFPMIYVEKVKSIATFSFPSFFVKNLLEKENINSKVINIWEETRKKNIDIDSDPYEKIADFILEKGADRIGFTTMGNNHIYVLLLSQKIKQKNPETTIFLGGPHASIVDKETLEKFSCIDFICRGEAERVVPHLADYFRGKEKLENIPNLTYRKDGRVVRNESAELIKGEEIPSIVYEKETVDKIEESSGKRSIFLEGGRGCVGNCTFCSTSNFWEKKYRRKPTDKFIREIKKNIAQTGVNAVKMTHDNFAFDKEKLKSFCKEIRNIDVEWACLSRADSLDKEIIKLMNESGCHLIHIGVESGDQEMQRIIRKNINLEKMDKMIDYIHKNTDIHMIASFVIGLPGEDSRSLLRTLKKAFEIRNKCGKGSAQIYNLIPRSGSHTLKKNKDKLIFDETIYTQSQDSSPLKLKQELELIRNNPDLFHYFYRFSWDEFNIFFFEAVKLIFRTLRFCPKTTHSWLSSFSDSEGEGFIESLGEIMDWKDPRKPTKEEFKKILGSKNEVVDQAHIFNIFSEYFEKESKEISKILEEEKNKIIGRRSQFSI